MSATILPPPNLFSYKELMELSTSTLQWDPLAVQKPAACIHFFQKKL